MARDVNWREKELSIDEVIKKYPDVPPIVILKMDIHRRGLSYTDAALKKLDPAIHQVNPGNSCFYGSNDYIPENLTLRDGSDILAIFDFDKNAQRDPYVVDVVDDKIVITDNGKVYEEAWYWEKPDYYDKPASNGVPLQRYLHARPQRLDVPGSSYCYFWDTPGHGCKYCTFTPNYLKNEKKNGGSEGGLPKGYPDIKYVEEAFREAIKQPGRYSSVMYGGGSILSGKELLDDEVDFTIEMIQMTQQYFDAKKIPSTLVATAYNDKQLERLYENTALMTYTTDIEVLNKSLFEWICPGKAAKIGFDEWKRRLYHSVDVFGRGNVTSGVVLGTELAKPNGFASEDEAYKHVVEEAEEIISHGIALAANVWRASPGSIFQHQDTPSLDYFIRVYREFDRLHHHYQVGRFTDDYRRCGAHPGLDLLRV